MVAVESPLNRIQHYLGDFLKDMSKSERLKLLLGNGFFPPELPPPFNTIELGTYRKFIFDNWPSQQPPKTAPEIYNIPRLGWKRRNLSIVNPISQFFLSKKISDEWVQIRNHLRLGTASLDHAYLQKGTERAIPKPDFSKIEFMKLKAGGDFDHILISDISRYYGTIYTHTLPWALHTKSWCKAHVGSAALKATLGDQLDVLVRKGQDNQTIGIPVGPDTSRILSEIIAVSIEKRFFELTPGAQGCAHRFVDDWFIGHNTAQAAETAMRNLAEACAEFELELNLEKTSIINAKDEIIEAWPNEILDLASSLDSKDQNKKLNRYFSQSFSLARSHPTSNVMDFALKVARSFRITKESYPLFESFVLRAARAYPITMPVVVQILANYRTQGAPINYQRCKKLIQDELIKSVPLRHTSEVAWALFLAKALKIKLELSCLEPITQVDNSVWALLVLDLENMSLIEGTLNKSHWMSLLTKESLVSSSWLLAYEADLKGWLTGPDPDFVKKHDWFKVLKAKNISFYNTNKNVDTFRRSRQRSITLAQRRRLSVPSLLSRFFTQMAYDVSF